MELTQLGNVTELDGLSREQVRTLAIENVKENGGVSPDTGLAYVYVNDREQMYMFQHRSLKHGVDRRYGLNKALLPHIGEVLKKSIVINELMPRKQKIGSYVLLGAAIDPDGNIKAINFIVNRESGMLENFDIVSSFNVKEPAAHYRPSFNTGSGSTVSIQNLINAVKENFGNVLSDDVMNTFGMERPTPDAFKDGRFDSHKNIYLKIGEVLKNSVAINEFYPRKTFSGAYVLLGASVDPDSGLKVVSFVVNRKSGELESFDVVYSLNIKEPAAQGRGLKLTTSDSSTISIKSLLDIVKDRFSNLLSDNVIEKYGVKRPTTDIYEDSRKYDLRGGDIQSKREVLIDMLDNQDLSAADRNRLELYRKKVSGLQAQKDNLAQLRGEYEALKARERGGQELGLSAKSRLAGLETEIGKLNRQVENLDMDLLKFEAMEPIDRLYKREVAKHEKMARDDYNQWITRYRDERKQRDRSRIAKNKIERAANGLKTALINPTNQKYVPEGMRIVLYEGTEQLYDFIEKSADPTFNKKLYFGAISKEHAQFIYDKTGIDVEGYNLALAADEIRKIFKDHGNAETEALRGQQPIGETDFADIVDVVQTPDKVSLSEEARFGKPVIEFEKYINGRTVVITVVSDKHRDLNVQTIYKGIKKESLATASGEQAPNNTPKATSGTASFSNSIGESDTDVKPKFDLRGGDIQSKREMLLSALEQQDISDKDKRILQEYKQHLGQMWEQERELAGWKKEQSALMKKNFNKEPMSQMERARLLELNKSIKDMENTIARLDRRLLNIEQMEPIKRAYKRQVDTEYKKAREMATRRIEDYRQWRKEADRGRIARGKIERAANGLKTALINPTNQKYVPEGMRRVVTDLISSIDMGNTQYEQNVLKGEGISKKAQNWRESMARLADISARHDAVANFGDDSASNIYFDPDLRAEINELLDKTRGELRYQDMALEQQEQLADILTEVHRAVNDANKMVMENRNMDEPSLKTIQELEQRKRYKLKKGAIGVIDQIFTSDFADSFTFAQAFGEEGRKILGLLQHEGFGKLVEIKYKSHFFVF